MESFASVSLLSTALPASSPAALAFSPLLENALLSTGRGAGAGPLSEAVLLAFSLPADPEGVSAAATAPPAPARRKAAAIAPAARCVAALTMPPHLRRRATARQILTLRVIVASDGLRVVLIERITAVVV